MAGRPLAALRAFAIPCDITRVLGVVCEGTSPVFNYHIEALCQAYTSTTVGGFRAKA